MNKDDKKDFTSAMGDLKGLLDKEGINIGHPVSNNDTNSTLAADLLDNELITQFEEQQKNTGYNPDHFSVDTKTENPQDAPDLPVLDGTITVTDENTTPDLDDYIADIDDDHFDVLEFADSVEDLEQTVASITEPEDLKKFAEQAQNNPSKAQTESPITATITPVLETTEAPESRSNSSFNEISEAIDYEQLKEKLHKELSFHIELSVAELKTKLLDKLEAELEAAFKKL